MDRKELLRGAIMALRQSRSLAEQALHDANITEVYDRLIYILAEMKTKEDEE